MPTFKQQLVDLGACPEARDWVGDKDLYRAWAECPKADWMVWLALRTDYPEVKLVANAVIDCIEARLNSEPGRENEELLREAVQAFRDNKAPYFYDLHPDLLGRTADPIIDALRNARYVCLTGAMELLEQDGTFTEGPEIIRNAIPAEWIILPGTEEEEEE